MVDNDDKLCDVYFFDESSNVTICRTILVKRVRDWIKKEIDATKKRKKIPSPYVTMIRVTIWEIGWTCRVYTWRIERGWSKNVRKFSGKAEERIQRLLHILYGKGDEYTGPIV